MNTSPLPTPQICFPGGDYLHFDVTTKNFNPSAQAQLKEIEAKVSGEFQGIEDINLGINFMMIRYNPLIISPISLAKYLREHWPAN
ncbi:hypothetical protein N5D79_17055 [Pseudomonas sp. GD03817]|uniref:Uncharacterized protein n=1 Tax=Pseudomonas asiatica TaxID=2219225 RepID=A0AAJ5LKB0_9PSED|nr:MULTISPECIES: hypothetical protein [Pseudomonas]MCE0990455.1 hypothetical protein [Pseudomonas alloputida]MDH1401818.1 hypothetical protein [Pseudomonas sp. GD03730]MDH1776583.1 hypothetical protein [Pseudomonas sp. GD03817]MEE1915468.1 hypothetical protein [Pseudomonas asiatica]QKL10232.1 hypothetical protein GEV41_29125 [Pseudomonas putida]